MEEMKKLEGSSYYQVFVAVVQNMLVLNFYIAFK